MRGVVQEPAAVEDESVPPPPPEALEAKLTLRYIFMAIGFTCVRMPVKPSASLLSGH